MRIRTASLITRPYASGAGKATVNNGCTDYSCALVAGSSRPSEIIAAGLTATLGESSRVMIDDDSKPDVRTAKECWHSEYEWGIPPVDLGTFYLPLPPSRGQGVVKQSLHAAELADVYRGRYTLGTACLARLRPSHPVNYQAMKIEDWLKPPTPVGTISWPQLDDEKVYEDLYEKLGSVADHSLNLVEADELAKLPTTILDLAALVPNMKLLRKLLRGKDADMVRYAIRNGWEPWEGSTVKDVTRQVKSAFRSKKALSKYLQKRGSTIIKFTQRASRGSKIRRRAFRVTKAAVNAHLAYAFGVKPLASDMAKTMDYMRKGSKTTAAKADRAYSVHTGSADVGNHPDGLYANARPYAQCYLESQTWVKPPTVTYAMVGVLKPSRSGVLQDFARRWGPKGPVEAIYNLTAYSFVLDWALDLRSVIRQLDWALGSNPYASIEMTISHSWEYHAAWNWRILTSCGNTVMEKLPYLSSHASMYVRRVVAVDPSGIRLSNRFGKNQLYLSISLALQKLLQAKR